MLQKNEFDAIYREYHPKVYRLCSGYASGNTDWAQETAQEVFITVWEKIGQLKERKALSSWIYRISINTCMRRLKEKNKQALNLETLPESAYSPEEQSEAGETLKMVYRAIESLKIEERNIALLLLEGVSNEDISEIFGISRTHLRVKIHRVRQKLKTLMQNERL